MQDLFFGRNSQRAQVGTGSGVIISPTGYIVTNNHVIDGAQSIEVTTNDNKIFEAELVGTDPSTDIALLKIEASAGGYSSVVLPSFNPVSLGHLDSIQYL